MGVQVSDKSDKFTFEVQGSDGEMLEDLDFNILINFEKPSLINKNYTLALVRNNTLLVNKGEFAYIDKDHLHIIDFKNSGTKFLYSLMALPKNGSIKVKNMKLPLNGTFSQDDINAGHVTFQQNGKEEEWDFFVFAIVDESGAEIGKNALPVKVVTNNSAPVFVNKNDLPIHKGSKAAITQSLLHVTDQEQGPDGLTYELVQKPKYGSLMNGDAVVKKGGQFTQQDIDEGKISYVHKGESMSDDSFAFTVNDGEGGVTPRSVLGVYVFELGADLPSLGNSVEAEGGDSESSEETQETSEKEGIHINEGATALLSPGDIFTSDEPAMQHMDFTITLVDLPKYGNILKTRMPPRPQMAFRRGRPMKAGDTFTKEDLANGLITFEHTDKEADEDQFNLKIFDNRRKHTHNQPFKVTVVKGNKPPVLVERHDLITNRGGHVSISNKLLKVVDAEQGPDQLQYMLVSRPECGSLTLGGKAVGNSGTFTQSDINNGKVAYVHNGGTGECDHFTFNISDGEGGTIEKVRVDIEISSKKISLLNNHPLSVNASDEAVFTSNNLEVVYTGEEKPSFSYSLKRLPEKGSVLLNGEALKPGMTFTQEQIDGGSLIYKHRAEKK